MSTLHINSQNWSNFAARIASPYGPDEHNEAAIERLMEYINPWVGHVKNVRPQFGCTNRILMIDFETKAEHAYYAAAMDRYLEEISKIRAGDMANSNFLELVAWLKFRQAAELVRAPWIAWKMYLAVQEGFAAGCACNFKATIAKVVLELHQKHKVPRSEISLVWGGDSAYSGAPATEGGRFSNEEIQQIMESLMRGEEVKGGVLMKIKKQLQASNAGLGDIPGYLELGPQSKIKRQEEIDRFQRGEALYSIFNFKSGGIGLSLHHSDAHLPKDKQCRRKKNGYVEVEDIPGIPTRPRCSFIAPTYSAIELVQGLGRYPRIASLSPTLQTLVFYKGTIEQRVAATVSTKLRCLSKVVMQKESWEDMILKGTQESLEERTRQQSVVIPDEEKIEGDDLYNLDIDDSEEDEEEEE